MANVKSRPLCLFRIDICRRVAILSVLYLLFIVCGEIQSAQKHVETDFSPEIQYFAERTINETVGSFHAAGGWALVQEVRTGRILAMASSTNGQYSTVNTVFEPGTLFKPFILAAALNEQLVTPCATTNSGANNFRYGNMTLQCHVPKEVTSSIKYTLALASSEVFHKIGLMLGDKLIEEYCRRFNFGAKLNGGLPSECEGFIAVDKDRNKRIASRISIGYGVGVTALQMINAYSCIANDGMLMRPSFGQCPMPEILGRPVTQEVARTMKDLLRITEDVQGKEMFESLHGLPAAGQAGMAQKKNDGYYSASEYYVAFAGFVPVDNPVFCVFVIVDAPKPLRTGGIVAFPAFAKISIATARILSVSK